MIKVKSHSDLYRDEETGAIINTSSDYTKYIEATKEREAKEAEIESIKSDVAGMKHMMTLILDKLNDKTRDNKWYRL